MVKTNLTLSNPRRLRTWLAFSFQGRRRKRAAAHAAPTVPTAPGNLSAVDQSVSIRLTWQDRSSDETGFRLYRKVDSGSYGLFQTIGANVTSYVDGDVVEGSVYYYYVTAFNAVGESGGSNVASLSFGGS